MKILIVMNDYFNVSNGMCISTQRFVKAFRSMGHEVRICANASNGTPDYPLSVFKIPVFNGIIEKEGFTFAKADKKVLSEAVEWADVVHVEDPFFICMQAAKIARKMKKPVTGTFHLYPENMTYSVHMGKYHVINKIFMDAFREMVYRRCKAIMCPTVQVRKRLRWNLYFSHLETISNGIADEIVNYGKRHQDIRDKKNQEDNAKFTILTTGRYSKEKNQKLLLEALRKSKHKEQIEVIVAGKGPLERKLRRMAKLLPCEVTFGFYKQRDLVDIMLRSDIYVHCANVEVEGMSCMEAFACGAVPVISDAKLSSTKSYALSPFNSYKANNAEDLAQKIDFWIEHPSELCRARGEYLELASNLRVSESAKKLVGMMEAVR